MEKTVFRLGAMFMGASAMSYAAWKDLGLRAVALISHEPPPTQIFIWLFIAFLALMVLEGLRANFLPARRRNSGSGRAPKTQPAAAVERQTSTDADSFDTASLRRPVPQLRNPKRQKADIRRTKPVRPGIRRTPNAVDWQDVSATDTVQAPLIAAGAPILFEPMEQFKAH
jgi:hypothetical protein